MRAMNRPALPDAGEALLAPSRRAPIQWVVLVALTWIVSGLFYLTLPPTTDQFAHAYMGWRLLEGDLPYHDFIDSNWPGVMGLHALAIALFGVNLWSWRALDFLLLAACSPFLADIVRQAAGARAFRFSLILLPLIYAGLNFFMAGQHDMSAAQFLVVGLWCHVRAHQRGSARWSLAAGVGIGLAMLSKPTVGVAGLLLPIQALLLGVTLRTTIRHTLANAVGLCVCLVMSGAIVVAMGTPLRDFIDGIFTINLTTQYLDAPNLTKPPLPRLIGIMTWEMIRGQWVLVLGSLPAVCWLLRRGNRSIATTTLPLLWLSGLLSYLVQSTTATYHLAPSIFAMAAMVPISVVLVTDERLRLGPARLHRWSAFLLLALLVAGLTNRLYFNFRSVPEALASGNFDQHLARFPSPAIEGVKLPEVLAFVRRLDSRPTGECVLALGTLSSINYLSKRPQGTRFYYFPYLYLAKPPMPLAGRWTDLWQSDLAKARCHYVLIANWIQIGWLHEPGPAPAALCRYLDAFREVGVLGGPGGMTVYERKETH